MVNSCVSCFVLINSGFLGKFWPSQWSRLFNTGCFQLTRAERGVSYLQRRDFVSCIQGRFSISTKWGVFPKYGGATLCPVYKGTSHFSEGFLRLKIPDNSRARKKKPCIWQKIALGAQYTHIYRAQIVCV